jgi:hypothetical protein
MGTVLTKSQGVSSVFQLSTAGSFHACAPLLINGQTNECRLDDWRGDTVFPPAFLKITKNRIHFNACLVFEVAIHGRRQGGARCSEFSAFFC